MRRVVYACLVGALVGGCGSAAREAAPKKCVLHVYFCTKDLCGRAATAEQMQRVEARLSARDDVYSVRFVSKDEALEIMRARHPAVVQQLPTNPLPDSLRVRPVKGRSIARIAGSVRARHAGVDQVRADSKDC
jgi:cell division protein FtsX